MKRNDAQVESLLDRVERMMQRFFLIFSGNELHWNQRGEWQLDDDPGEVGQALISQGEDMPPTWGSALGVYDLAYFLPGVPDANAWVGRVVQVRSILLEAGLADSRAVCRVAPTAERVLTILQNTTSIGTITFAASSTTGVFALAADVTLSAGDVLVIQIPATNDATFEDVSVTIAAEEV